MKANRKFVNGEEAVSAVIGVILMVAITVAIAATVYIYVSGMLGAGPARTPVVALIQSQDYISVQSCDTSGISYDSVNVTFVNSTGGDVGDGSYNDVDGDGYVSGGDTITPPSGLTSGETYTVTMTYQGDAIGTCKFVAP